MKHVSDFSLFERAANQEQRGCVGKVQYTDAEAAERARLAMQAKTGEAFDAYPCGFCGAHHVGHSRQLGGRPPNFPSPAGVKAGSDL